MLKKTNLESTFDRVFRDDGEDYVACCPVHNEKTPSFYVHKEKNLVHCFGCGASGNLVKFVMDYKGVEAKEAEKLLGLTSEDEFDQYFNNEKPTPTEPKIYPESWLAPFKKEIHKYVTKRGFSISTLIKAGSLYDSDRRRQVFPHRDKAGRLVGAIGRSCNGREPKWYYYWGYPKGRYLFSTPRREDGLVGGVFRTVWIVEGVFDALWLYQHGIDAVAILGSKPTDVQLSQLKDIEADALVVALDNDEAGLAGTRHIYTRLKNHINLLSPIWPRWGIDVVDVDPTKLPLLNVIQWQLISTPS